MIRFYISSFFVVILIFGCKSENPTNLTPEVSSSVFYSSEEQLSTILISSQEEISSSSIVLLDTITFECEKDSTYVFSRDTTVFEGTRTRIINEGQSSECSSFCQGELTHIRWHWRGIRKCVNHVYENGKLIEIYNSRLNISPYCTLSESADFNTSGNGSCSGYSSCKYYDQKRKALIWGVTLESCDMFLIDDLTMRVSVNI